MFTNYRPKSKVTLYAYTSTPGLAEHLAPARLTQILPEWWQRLPPYVESSGEEGHSESAAPLSMMTAKHCFAFQELFKRGVGVRLWADVNISTTVGKVTASSSQAMTAGMIHPTSQHAGAIGHTGQHFKIYSPWSYVCDTPMRFFWMHPFYHQSDHFRFQTMPGIVEYQYQHKTNLNLVVSRAAPPLSLTAGEMVAYLLPLTDCSVNVIAEQISESDMERINFAERISFRPFAFRRKHGLRPFKVSNRK
jgi:hypothetical protein